MHTYNYTSNNETSIQSIENLHLTNNLMDGNTTHQDVAVSSIYTWDQFMNELEFE